MATGKFVISLDFELMWGVRDKRTIASYGSNIIGVHTVVPKLLAMFKQYKVAATFSTVGFLFFKNKKELLQSIPEILPAYIDDNLTPYATYINALPDVAKDDYHFAPDLINQIKQEEIHEIGTHTFSHYYCLEPGQTVQSFEQDLTAASQIAQRNNTHIKSLVFPRNQCNETYLNACKNQNVICYRGTEKSWIYNAQNASQETLVRRFLRMLDTYVNISGHNTYTLQELNKLEPIINLPASRFLRPFSKKLSILEKMRLQRILNSMTYAAKNKQMFHLWWHPHNFGLNQEQNFLFLNNILIHFEKLNKTYGFESITMADYAQKIMDGHE